MGATHCLYYMFMLDRCMQWLPFVTLPNHRYRSTIVTSLNHRCFVMDHFAAASGYRVVVDPDRGDAYTFRFRGQPGDVSSAQWWGAEVPKPPPTPTPTPPPPTPTPPPPTPPTPPVPVGWECHEGMDNHKALAAAPFNLTGSSCSCSCSCRRMSVVAY
jgi:hypothetical protein